MSRLSLVLLVILPFLAAGTSGQSTSVVHFTDHNLITDVCGIVRFDGLYHMFYQHFELPSTMENDLKQIDRIFDKLSWGHATSTDLLKWTIHEKIINSTIDPNPTFHQGKPVIKVSKLQPFSGSAIVDTANATGLLKHRNRPILMVYTSLSKFLYEELDPKTNANFIHSTVYMYYSYDGYKFTQYDAPIINRSETIRNFRDPVVFKFSDGHYNLIMEENTQLGIHKSFDLINWQKTSTFDYPLSKDEVERETPNLVRVDDHWLLVISSNLEPATGDFHYCTVKYFVGSFDGYEFNVERNQSRTFDGPDLYAISISTDHIMMGMLNNWKYLSSIKHVNNGTLTYPRKIGKMKVNNSTYLTQRFVNLDAFSEMINTGDIVDDKLIYSFMLNRPHYIKIKMTNLNCTSDCDFKLKFTDSDNVIRIGYSYSTNDFYLDRSESMQVNSYFNNVHKYKPKYEKLLNNDEFDIDIILDVNTIELLTDRGLVAMTALHLNNKIYESLTLTTNRKYKITQFTVKYYP